MKNQKDDIDIEIEIIPPEGSTAYKSRSRFEKTKDWFTQDFKQRMRLWPLWGVLVLYGLSPVLYIVYMAKLLMKGEVFWFLLSLIMPPLGIVAAYFWLVFDVIIGGLIRAL